jgi:peptide/nickel transport system substrate-binding protein
VLNKELVLKHIKATGEFGELGDYGKEWLTLNDAGSGPYKVKRFVMGEKLVMEKFSDYWAGFADKAPDIVEMIGTTEAITIRTLMANKELEFTDQWQTLENFKEIKKIEGVHIEASMDTTGGWYLMMNTMKPPLDDVHVRRALQYVLDYDKIVTELFPGTVKFCGPVNSAMLGWNPDIPECARNVTKAQEELAKSKYAQNITEYNIELHWCAEVPDEEKVSMLFMANAAEIGITITPIKTPWTKMVQEASSIETKPHIVYISAGGAYPEAGALLMNRYHSKNALTWMQNENLFNSTLDALIEDALQTLDFDERMEKYKQIQWDIYNIAPSVYLFQGIGWHAMQGYVTAPYTQTGKFVKSGVLGDVYIYNAQSGGLFDFRLYKVDRLIPYG